jgi:hypothetical protein
VWEAAAEEENIVRGRRYQGGREETNGPPWLNSMFYFNVVRHLLLYGAICCIVMSRGIVIFQYIL